MTSAARRGRRASYAACSLRNCSFAWLTKPAASKSRRQRPGGRGAPRPRWPAGHHGRLGLRRGATPGRRRLRFVAAGSRAQAAGAGVLQRLLGRRRRGARAGTAARRRPRRTISASIRNPANASDRPKCDSSAAMPRPAARPTSGPIHRDMPVLAAPAAAAGAACLAIAAPGCAGITGLAAAPGAVAGAVGGVAAGGARSGAGCRSCGRRTAAWRRQFRWPRTSARRRRRWRVSTFVSWSLLRCPRVSRRSRRCRATTPAARLWTSTRSKPACSIIAFSAAWSGCMRIDSAR